MGIVPHTCTPLYEAGGISLSYEFSDAGAGDCVFFRPPDPVEPGASGPATVSADDLALSAFDRAIALAGTPRLGIAPSGIGLAGLRTFFWTPPPRNVVASASAGDLVVTAEARAERFVWRFGDGSERSTLTSGRVWTRRRPGNIGHVYQRSGRYGVELEVIWAARWRIGAGAWRALGFFSTTSARDYPVRRILPLLVRSPR